MSKLTKYESFEPEEHWEDGRMDREIINLLDIYDKDDVIDLLTGDDYGHDFEYIEEDVVNYDIFNSWVEISVVVKRKSDNKYFKTTYEFSDDGGYDIQKFKEVYPVKKTITDYE